MRPNDKTKGNFEPTSAEDALSTDHENETARIARRSFLQASTVAGLAAVGLSGTVAANTSPGDVIWEYDDLGDVCRSPPTIVDDVVYAGGRGVNAIDARSGEEKWSMGGSVTMWHTSPNVVDGTVYAAETDGTIHALGAEGDDSEYAEGMADPQWDYEAEGRGGRSPTAVDGLVYFGDEAGIVYAIDAETGDEEWRFDDYDHPIRSSPTVVDGTVYIGAGDYQQGGGPTGGVYALDADTGEEVWAVEHEQDGFEWQAETPTVADGVVYVTTNRGGAGGDAGLFAYDAETGDEQYSVVNEGSMSTWSVSPPTVAGDTIYVSTVSDVRAIDAATGDLRWTANDGSSSGTSMAIPTVADGTVFTANSDAELFAFDGDDGSEVWSSTIESDSDDDTVINTHQGGAGPTVVNGTLFIPAEMTLFAVDAGVDGHSEDTKVTLGTLGHHHEWAGTAAPTDPYDGEAPEDDEEEDEGEKDDHEYEDFCVVGGKVTDPDTGDPIGGADVTLYDPDGDNEVQTGVTGGNGHYCISEADGAGIYEIHVSHEDYEDVGTQVVTDVGIDPDELAIVDVVLGEDANVQSSLEGTGDDGSDDGTGEDDTGNGGSGDEAGGADDDGSPGPGIVGTVASICGVGYLLSKRAGRANHNPEDIGD